MSGTAYDKQVGTNLRALRSSLGMSLMNVEEKSRGRFKAVVVGAWERDDRCTTMGKLHDLICWYGVTVSSLLPDEPPPPPPAEVSAVLERVEDLAKRIGELRDLVVLGVSYGSAHDSEAAAQ